VSGLRPPAAVPPGAAAGTGLAGYTTLPEQVTPVAALAGRIVAGAGGDGARAATLSAYLRQVPYSGQAPPALSYGALERMLLPATAALSMGDVGAHAAAFALLARTQGLPTRIVVGYRLPAAAGG